MDQLTEKQQALVAKLRERYAGVHPVLFKRMLERAKNEVELFDSLDTLPDSYPMAWDVEKRRLTQVMDILKQG